MIYCKVILCDWNKWDSVECKHVCGKTLIHLNQDGTCELAKHASKIPKLNKRKEVTND